MGGLFYNPCCESLKGKETCERFKGCSFGQVVVKGRKKKVEEEKCHSTIAMDSINLKVGRIGSGGMASIHPLGNFGLKVLKVAKKSMVDALMKEGQFMSRMCSYINFETKTCTWKCPPGMPAYYGSNDGRLFEESLIDSIAGGSKHPFARSGLVVERINGIPMNEIFEEQKHESVLKTCAGNNEHLKSFMKNVAREVFRFENELHKRVRMILHSKRTLFSSFATSPTRPHHHHHHPLSTASHAGRHPRRSEAGKRYAEVR